MIFIDEQTFLNAYHKHHPAGWIKFAFKYFSRSTEERDSKPSKFIQAGLFAIFGAGFVATVTKQSRAVRGTITLLFFIILFPLVTFLMAAAWANNARIKRICKELDITIEIYNILADNYLT